ncbi:hypothetical protein HK097_006204 [Rhizophlyctis rosea]|uniref:RGS domain-containing protein n=1 Tax=Rhizophlyctis rosea TaxID=64517 RepID=A0AAD5S173_9FUNG|nr:hypothetical protein HK097_006204 [Rhizophlyctis rosea]
MHLFFDPAGPQELNVPSKIMKKLKEEIKVSTHPDVFEEAIRHCVDLMRTSSLPKFLARATKNIDSGRERAERMVKGLLWISITIAVMIVLLYYHQSRWYRLFTIPPTLMATLYFQTFQTQVCFTYMGRRQREILITEMTPETLPKPRKSVFSSGPPTELEKGDTKSDTLSRRVTRKAKGTVKIVGRTFKEVEEPLVLKLQQSIKDRVLRVGVVATVLLTCGLLGIPEDVWKR